MYLFYVDESGNTGANLDSTDQPIHWLVAVGVTPAAVMEIETEMLTLAANRFGLEARHPEFELHGAHIFSGRTAPYRRLSVSERVELYADLLALIGRAQAKLFIRGIDKQRHKQRAGEKEYEPDHPHRLGFMYLVEQLDEWLEQSQPPDELFGGAGQPQYGLLVADEQKEIERDVVRGFASWRMYGTDYGYRARHIRFLIDTVHYVPSQDSWLIQLADCVAFIRNRHARILRKYGFDDESYSPSDRAVSQLWREHCLPHVISERLWP